MRNEELIHLLESKVSTEITLNSSIQEIFVSPPFVNLFNYLFILICTNEIFCIWGYNPILLHSFVALIVPVWSLEALTVGSLIHPYEICFIFLSSSLLSETTGLSRLIFIFYALVPDSAISSKALVLLTGIILEIKSPGSFHWNNVG